MITEIEVFNYLKEAYSYENMKIDPEVVKRQANYIHTRIINKKQIQPQGPTPVPVGNQTKVMGSNRVGKSIFDGTSWGS